MEKESVVNTCTLPAGSEGSLAETRGFSVSTGQRDPLGGAKTRNVLNTSSAAQNSMKT